MSYEPWIRYFENNKIRQGRLDAAIPWHDAPTMSPSTSAGLAASLQKFQLGEGGDGLRLIASADAAGDPHYSAAIRLFIAEEQGHSALLMKALDHLNTPALESHWSDVAFVLLRRAMGLRLELMLFLVAELAAEQYFAALRDGAPDQALRQLGGRILGDEHEHIRFQYQRLHEGYRESGHIARNTVRLVWRLIAIGTASVVALDHARALRSCGLAPSRFFRTTLREFSKAVSYILDGNGAPVAGPLTATAAAAATSLR